MKVVKLLPVLLVALFFLGQAEEGEAQVSFGPQVMLWDFEEAGVGGKIQYELGDALEIDDGVFEGLYGAFDGNYIFGFGDGTALMFNVNAAVPFSTDAAVTPFAGAGINHWRVSSDGPFSVSASGLNLLGGLEFDLGAVPAFAQLAYATSSAGFLTVSAGVMFGN